MNGRQSSQRSSRSCYRWLKRWNAFSGRRKDMVSAAHQWLLLWLVRKMTADGFVVRGCDGPLPQGGLWNALPRALEAERHPPRRMGHRPGDRRVCVRRGKNDGGCLDATHSDSAPNDRYLFESRWTRMSFVRGGAPKRGSLARPDIGRRWACRQSAGSAPAHPRLFSAGSSE